jgi:hypothetical protein
MYLVPVLLLIDASNPISAEALAASELQNRAIHIGAARRLSPPTVATAELDLVVYANRIDLPPAPRPA